MMRNYEISWVVEDVRKREGFDTLFEAMSFVNDLLSGVSTVCTIMIWKKPV